MRTNFPDFCSLPLSEGEINLLSKAKPDLSQYPRTIRGTKTSLLLALAMSEEDDINYQEFATEDEDVKSLRALRLSKKEIATLFDLADSMIGQTIRKSRVLIGNPQEKRALQNVGPALTKILASYTRMRDISKHDRDTCDQELADLMALFNSACKHKDLETLSWIYFRSLKEYTEPDPEPALVEAEKPAPITPIFENIFALQPRKTAVPVKPINEDESEEITQQERDSMRNMLDLSKPLIPKNVLDDLGQIPSYEVLSDDRQSQINNMANCEVVIGFIRELQDSIANHLDRRTALPSAAAPEQRGFTPRLVR